MYTNILRTLADLCSDAQCNSSYSFATPVIQMLPYFWRLLQCCRRYHDTKQVFPHAYNAGKYTCSIVVLWISAFSRASGSTGWQLAWIFFGLLSSCYSLYWDVVMDWSLYQINEGWLQRDLLYPAKWYYIYALTTNAILRFLWLISVNPAAIGIDVPRKVLMFMLAVCEVYRYDLYRMICIQLIGFIDDGNGTSCEWRTNI